jgi:photosystem II stability/assembly factor-like uncharacterized protein
MSTTYYLTPNEQVNGVYQGSAYVFDTSGGFAIDQAFPQINLNTYSPVSQYDVTHSLQIRFSVRTLNNKIGIIKDQSNIGVLEVLYYDLSNDILCDIDGAITDSVTVTANDLLAGVSTKNIVSMGKMSTLYSDFNYTVMEYFGAPYGFSTVFANADTFNANDGIFDASAFVNLIHGITFDGVTGSVISDLSGYFTVYDINKHLRFICGTNVFGNRPPTGNFGVPNGFVPGDLIYIPNGISITLSVAVEPEPYTPIDNVGPTNLASVDDMVNYSEPQLNIHKVTTSSITNITQTYSVPILIILDNEDTFDFINFGKQWIDSGSDLGDQYWLTVAVSSSGQYQVAIDNQGDVYLSTDYGSLGSWNTIVNVGISDTIAVAISKDGNFITATNGVDIFTTSDTGNNWAVPFTTGTNNVFVSVSLGISLDGRYQAMLSCGDNLYMSSDGGATFNPLDITLSRDNSDLYNSIQSFPTGSICLSFTGKYQTIACESLWISSDYGVTWKPANPPNPNEPDPNNPDFNDRNWDGISISSDGRVQTATDSGGYIYNSQDYGHTWIAADIADLGYRTWQSISISSNGNFQTALDVNGYIFVSPDFGLNWKLTDDTTTYGRNWQAISLSANGQYQTGVVFGGSIYCSNLL